MQAKVSNILNVCTLVGLGSVFLSFYCSGRIDQYLNPLFRPLVLAGGLVTVFIGLTRLMASAPEHHRHHCSAGDCDHQHANGILRSLVCFGLVCIPVLAGGTFSKDAFDQQILATRAPIEADAEPAGPYMSNAGSHGNGLYGVASRAGFIRSQDHQLSSTNGNGPASRLPVPADGNIPVEVTDLLRAETIQPLRDAIAGKNVAVVGQFVPGSKENSFKLTRMFIWCCAADARPIHVKVEVPVPVNVPNLQWVKVIGIPEYSTGGDHARLVVKAQSVVPVKPPKDAMLY
jgi:uncharacterized repeat protein (TIGR03943 family)